MKLRILQSFKEKLNEQVEYISKDKPGAARKFKGHIISQLKNIPRMPFANRKSIFFDREDIRDLIVKGYIIVYKVDLQNRQIDVFGFIKYKNELN